MNDMSTKSSEDAAQPTQKRARPVRRTLIWSGRVVLLLLLATVVYLYLCGPFGPNFHTVTAGSEAMYRSGQLSAGDLECRVKEHNIKTVVNLRGEHVGEEWYDAEKAKTDELGIKLVNIKMSGRKLPPRQLLLDIIDALQNQPRPILFHCKAGADRSGLVSALEKLLKDPDDFQGARAQLAVFPYGHTGLQGNDKMDEFLDIYERYKKSGGMLDLKAWAEQVYDEGGPP